MEPSKILEKMFPDKARRKASLTLLAEAVHHAHEQAPDGWSVHADKTGVRLVVGQHIVLTLHEKKIWMALDVKLLEELTQDRAAIEDSHYWVWDEYSNYSRYKKNSVSKRFLFC